MVWPENVTPTRSPQAFQHAVSPKRAAPDCNCEPISLLLLQSRSNTSTTLSGVSNMECRIAVTTWAKIWSKLSCVCPIRRKPRVTHLKIFSSTIIAANRKMN